MTLCTVFYRHRSILWAAAVTLQINRNLSIPIYTQIVGQLQFDIVSGRLPSGSQLPSIRELAVELGVAPMTISQAYQELRQLGLIEMRHGSGTFVASYDVAHVDGVTPNRQLQLRRVLQRAIDDARHQGFVEDEIKQGFLSLLTSADGLFTSRRLVLLGLFSSALRVYADDIERNLAVERVVVEPITFDEISAHPSLYQPRIDQAEALLAPLHQVQATRELLHNSQIEWSGPILGMNFVLRPSAENTIRALTFDASIGIVSRFPEFVNTMLQVISTIHPFVREPVVCLSENFACLQEMSTQVQAIIYATGANDAIAALSPFIPATTPLIEYLHTPDETTFQRIRQWLKVDASVPLQLSETV